jgi:hypothetical protein
MARNGNTARTATVSEVPADLYDTLSPDAQLIWDAIGILGYTPEQSAVGLWWARKTGSKHAATVGPIESLAALLPAVKEEIVKLEEDSGVETEPDDGEILLTEDHKGNTYLPGVEQVVDQQLKDAAFNEWTDKQAWKEAGKKKKESKAALDAVSAAKKSLFYPDPAKSSDLIYKCGGITVRMAKEFTVKTKTELTEEDDE